jgi:ABC-type transport system substrate-binding protein
VAGGLRRHRRHADQEHRRGAPELPAGGPARRQHRQPLQARRDKAKALLAKAGYPNGFKVTIDMRTTQPVQGITEAFQQTAKRAGIDIEILPGDGKQTLTKYRARTHDMYIGQWGADYWDPHTNADTFARNPDNATTPSPSRWPGATPGTSPS